MIVSKLKSRLWDVKDDEYINDFYVGYLSWMEILIAIEVSQFTLLQALYCTESQFPSS